MRVIVLVVAALLATTPVAAQTVLETTADAMAPGTWAVVPGVGNLNLLLQAGTNITSDTGSGGCWDVQLQQWHFIGGADSGAGSHLIHVVYSASTNAWAERPIPFSFVHGWDSTACDVRGRRMYRRNGPGDNSFWIYNLDAQTWTQSGTIPNSYPSMQAGFAWHYELGSRGRLVVMGQESGSSGLLSTYDPATGTWASLGLHANIDQNAFAEYSEIHNVALFGGEGGGFYRMTGRGAIASMPAAPCQIRMNRGAVLYADPKSGNFELFCDDNRQYVFDPTATGSWTQRTSGTGGPGATNHIYEVPENALGDTWGLIGIGVTDHGVLMVVKCNSGACSQRLFKTPGRQWAASDRDFKRRCYAPGVVTCYHFDSAAQIAGTIQADPHGTYSGTPTIDAQAASGSGAVKFTIPAGQSGAAAGALFINNREDYSSRFGANSTFWLQWRQRLDANYVAVMSGVEGKQMIYGRGSIGPGSANTATSCTSMELVLQNNGGFGFPQAYHHCPPINQLETGGRLQNARPSPYCDYSDGGGGNPTSWFFDGIHGNCLPYVANEWVTFTKKITVGPRVGDAYTNSRYELWMAREGQASEKLIDITRDFDRIDDGEPPSGSANSVWGQMTFTNFVTSGATFPAGGVSWIDEFLVSTQPIADPGAPSQAPPATPNPPTSVSVSYTMSEDPPPAPITITPDFSTLSAAGRTNTTLARPANVVNGDFLLATVYIEDEIPLTPPAGWTLIVNADQSGSRPQDLYVYYKRASNEPASWTWTHAGAFTAGFVQRLTGVVASGDPEDAVRSVRSGSGATITWDGITTQTPGAVVLGIMGHWHSGTLSNETMTERLNVSTLVLIGDVQTSAGATGNKTGTWSSASDQWMSMLIALRPQT